MSKLKISKKVDKRQHFLEGISDLTIARALIRGILVDYSRHKSGYYIFITVTGGEDLSLEFFKENYLAADSWHAKVMYDRLCSCIVLGEGDEVKDKWLCDDSTEVLTWDKCGVESLTG